MTEQEQIQQLKAWIKSYGPFILAGIVIALLMSSGWRAWQRHQNKTLMRASAVYDDMLTHRAENNAESENVAAKKLLDRFTKTPYADMAALMIARSAILKKDYAAAEEQLHWVIKHSKTPAIREIGRIRLARLLITEMKPDAALELLKTPQDKVFIGLENEVRGDAFMTKHDTQAAKHAYQLALTEIPNAEVTRPILQMKYDNLA